MQMTTGNSEPSGRAMESDHRGTRKGKQALRMAGVHSRSIYNCRWIRLNMVTINLRTL